MTMFKFLHTADIHLSAWIGTLRGCACYCWGPVLLQGLAESMGDVVILPLDFALRRQTALNGLEMAQGLVARVAPRLQESKKELEGLSVNLASLEKYMESSEPTPFVVDDVLVDFDDERSQAALMALSALSEKTQVILFTHHLRVVEQAEKMQGAVQVHLL